MMKYEIIFHPLSQVCAIAEWTRFCPPSNTPKCHIKYGTALTTWRIANIIATMPQNYACDRT